MSYTWFKVGFQKRLEQTQRRGRRISILGLLEPKLSFEYGLAVGGFNSASYIRLLECLAELAAVRLGKTGQLTVVVQDNGSIHTSLEVQERIPAWESQGKYAVLLAQVLLSNESD